MGGAAGHISHLYENDKLTFSDIKSVLLSASEGKLVRVSEKLDGMNLMFTCLANNEIRVARTTADIKSGGLSGEALAKKFAGRGNVEDAFKTCFSVLTSAMDSLSDDRKKFIFGDDSQNWYSLEIIYSGLANTINYDKNHIVFHGWPIYEFNPRLNLISNVQSDSGLEELKNNVENMQNAISIRNWHVSGPAILRLKKLADGSILQKALHEITIAQTSKGLTDRSTIQEFIYNCALDDLSNIPRTPAELTASRIAQLPGHLPLNKIKSIVPNSLREFIGDFVKNEKQHKKRWLMPIELAIHDFSIEVLRGLQSSLIDNSNAEVARLQSVLKTSIDAIKSSGNDDFMRVLTTQMEKLKSVENLASPMEGIVFLYKGQAYKFTGAFAPAHQIISLFSFKNDMPVVNQTTGGVFKGVDALSLEEYQFTYRQLSEDLRQLGAYDLRPIGTTGKKSVMSDIDLTCQYEDVHELYENIELTFGKQNVKRVGRNISIKYPIFSNDGLTERYVQVDVMPGEPEFMCWSRYAPSPEQGHSEYSPVKGVIRNILLNQILRVMSEHVVNEISNLNRKRYALDFDKGLYLISQTKKGKKQTLKEWKTLDRNFLSSDPDEIVSLIFGEGFNSKNVKTFEQTLYALLTSEKTKHAAKRILENFEEELQKFSITHKKFFNSDPLETLDYIKSLVND